jgi:hypothetical protein
MVLNKDMLYRHYFSTLLSDIIRTVQVHQDGLKLNGTHQFLIHADLNILGRSIHTRKKNTEALVFANKGIRLEVNADKTKYCTWLHLEIRMQNEVTI